MSTARARNLLPCAALAVVAMAANGADTFSEDQVASAIARLDYDAATQLLRARLVTEPGDATSRFTLARVLAWSGEYAASLTEYDGLIVREPANVDYSLGRAQTLVWAHEDEAALAEIARALSLSPDYEDVWRLELTVLERGKGNEARVRALRAEAAARFPSSSWWQGVEERVASVSSTDVSFGTVHETLSTDVPDWTSSFVQLTRHRADGISFYGALREEERFGASDSVVAGGAAWPLPERWTMGVDLELTPNAAFLPRAAASVWAARPLGDGWETELRLRHRDYSDVQVTSTSGAIAKYFGDFRASYTLDLSVLDGDATSAAHSATLAYYLSPRTQLNAGIAAGEEAEAVAPGQVLRTNVHGYSLGFRLNLNERWRLLGSVGSHTQGDFYTRRYVGLSVAAGL